MTNEDLAKEIYLIRDDIKAIDKKFSKGISTINENFFVFKGKAYGFMLLLSILINVGVGITAIIIRG